MTAPTQTDIHELAYAAQEMRPAQRLKFLSERFEGLREEVPLEPFAASEWTALCPLCPPDSVARLRIDPQMRISACPGGHESADILDAIKISRGEEEEHGEPLFQPLGEFFAGADEQIAFLYEPYVIAAGLTLISAAPKSGKSFFGAWLATECARKGHTVLFVEEEGSKAILRKRFEPFVTNAADFNDRLLVAHRRGWRLDDERSVNRLIEEAKAARAAVIILDPFIQIHGQDENKPSEMAIVMRAIERIIRETGCAVILVHHTRKGSSWDKNVTDDMQSSDSRGSGGPVGAADNVFMLRSVPRTERRPGELRFYIENTDTRVGEPEPKRLAVIRIDAAGASDAMTFAEPDSPALKVLRDLLPYVPEKAEEAVSIEALRKACGMGMARVQSGVSLGFQTGALVRRIKGGGIFRAENTKLTGL